MTRSPCAERIRAELQQALPRQEHVFSGEAFDPATAAHAFRLAGTDCTVSVLSGALLARVFEQSPGSTVLFSRWHHVVFADAGHGLVDLLVHGGTPPPLRTRVLFEEGYSCLMSRATTPLPSGPRCRLGITWAAPTWSSMSPTAGRATSTSASPPSAARGGPR